MIFLCTPCAPTMLIMSPMLAWPRHRRHHPDCGQNPAMVRSDSDPIRLRSKFSSIAAASATAGFWPQSDQNPTTVRVGSRPKSDPIEVTRTAAIGGRIRPDSNRNLVRIRPRSDGADAPRIQGLAIVPITIDAEEIHRRSTVECHSAHRSGAQQISAIYIYDFVTLCDARCVTHARWIHAHPDSARPSSLASPAPVVIRPKYGRTPRRPAPPDHHPRSSSTSSVTPVIS